MVALRVEHLRNEAAISHRDLIAEAEFSVFPVFGEEGLHHPKTFGDPVTVLGVDAFVVELVGRADVLQRAQVVERMKLAGDDLRKSAHVSAIERVPQPGQIWALLADWGAASRSGARTQ